MTAPLIGLSTYGRDEKNHVTLPMEYLESVRRAGGIPLLIGPGEPRLSELLSRLDGLILTGGGDLDPKLYGGSPHETVYMLDEERDTTEMAMAHYILKEGLPTLGICRGTQILNVALGGTLFEHLPDTFGESVNHRLPPREPTPHDVSILPDSQLAQILKQPQATGASWHHQAIREVADSLNVVAHAPDGVIEAVEMPDHPWLVAVQWHPELTTAEDPVQQRIFDAFIQATMDLKQNRVSNPRR